MVVCDICEKRIANNKCFFCDKDLCSTCGNTDNYSGVRSLLIMRACNKCRKGISIVLGDKILYESLGLDKVNKKFLDEIKPLLKKGLIIKNLEVNDAQAN